MLRALTAATDSILAGQSRPLSCLQRSLATSDKDIAETQRELDGFFGAEHSPEERGPIDGVGLASNTLSSGSASQAVTTNLTGDHGHGCDTTTRATSLTHVQADGRASMVDVGEVRALSRTTQCTHLAPRVQSEALALLRDGFVTTLG